jgi:hypothetical protein
MATAEVGDLLLRELYFDMVRLHRSFTLPLREIIPSSRGLAQQLPSP